MQRNRMKCGEITSDEISFCFLLHIMKKLLTFPRSTKELLVSTILNEIAFCVVQDVFIDI